MRKPIFTHGSVSPNSGAAAVRQPHRPAYRETRGAPLCDFPVRDEILHLYLRLPVHADVLEVGPGAGYTAYWLAPQVHNLTLLDTAPRTLRALEHRLASRPNVDFLHWDICTPGLADLLGPTIDVVYGLDSFEYVRDAPAALQNIRAVLRPGGMMLLSFPNFVPGDNHMVHHFPSRADAAEALRAAGFRRWEIAAVKLRRWPALMFRVLHEWPVNGFRRWRAYNNANARTFDETWNLQHGLEWERYARFIQLYWSGLSGLMRLAGDAYQPREDEENIVSRQLVIRAWR